MREIKFRAWDSYKKCMREVIHPFGGSEDFNDIPDGKITFGYAEEWDEIYILMQYTGLKDKNGVNIYEGDVVRHLTEEPFRQVHGEWVDYEVLYRNGMWIDSYLMSATGKQLPRGYTASELVNFRISESSKEVVFVDDEYYQKLDLEVIGNIYSNPELLTTNTPQGKTL